MLFSYQTGYVMWHSRLRIYIPWGVDFFRIFSTNKQILTFWQVCPELGNFRRYRSLLMLNVLFPVDFHHYIMARTDTDGCLNHLHDRRYCCHHCPWYLSAVYCLSHFDRSWSFIMEAILWRMWRHVITWPLSSLKCIGQRLRQFQKVIIIKMGFLGGYFQLRQFL